MNIFEFLGSEPRDIKKVTQLVKHWDEVTEKNKKNKTFSVQVKADGVCSIVVVKDLEVKIFSRTGKEFSNMQTVIKNLPELPDGVYLGEVHVPKHIASLEEVSGLVNPNRVNLLTDLQVRVTWSFKFMFFDYIDTESFIAGKCPTSFVDRMNNLCEILGVSTNSNSMYPIELTHFISVCPGRQVDSEETILALYKLATNAHGEEGIVIRDAKSNWLAGHKGFRAMKLVRGVDYDLLCIDVEEGTGKYEGKIANLIFKWEGNKTVKAMLGKGWTHVMAEDMYNNIKSGTSTPVGKIFQVTALEESSKGKLRLPKVGEERFDKLKADI